MRLRRGQHRLVAGIDGVQKLLHLIQGRLQARQRHALFGAFRVSRLNAEARLLAQIERLFQRVTPGLQIACLPRVCDALRHSAREVRGPVLLKAHRGVVHIGRIPSATARETPPARLAAPLSG